MQVITTVPVPNTHADQAVTVNIKQLAAWGPLGARAAAFEGDADSITRLVLVTGLEVYSFETPAEFRARLEATFFVEEA